MSVDQSAPASGSKPAVLIIGGLGYTGRHLAKYIYDNNLASEYRIVDKHLPELAWLAPEFKEACSRERFIQADAAQEKSLPRIFDREGGAEFDFVFNCGGETRFSQEEKVYELRSYGLSLALGRESAKRKIKCYVELSTGMVYKPKTTPRKETDEIKPWSNPLAKWKMKAEEDLAKIEGLNLMIMRMAHVYGPYTSKFLSTALCMARVYQSKGKEMRFLWSDNLRTNTVHIEDAVRALWHGAEWYIKEAGRPKPAVFNVVDHGNTSQKITAQLMHEIFNIETGFHGTLISAFARMNLDHVVDEVNDDTLDPWAELQQAAGISQSTPLSPFMEKELIRDSDLSLDGSAFETTTGFTYKHEKITKEGVEAVIESYKKMNWWP